MKNYNTMKTAENADHASELEPGETTKVKITSSQIILAPDREKYYWGIPRKPFPEAIDKEKHVIHFRNNKRRRYRETTPLHIKFFQRLKGDHGPVASCVAGIEPQKLDFGENDEVLLWVKKLDTDSELPMFDVVDHKVLTEDASPPVFDSSFQKFKYKLLPRERDVTVAGK